MAGPVTNELLTRLSEIRVVPVVVMDDASLAERLADALVQGGLPCAEVTLRTEGALSTIRTLAQRDDIIVGAGTVVSASDLDRAAEAGARFAVSPGLDLSVSARAADLGIPLIPGVATASELQAAVNAGLRHVKLFPAALIGGVQMIDALAGPFPGVHFMPSGGLTLETSGSYLANQNVFCIGGSWMVRRGWLRDGDFASVVESAKMTVATIAGIDDGGRDVA